MSMTLGPIHYWLYGKISNQEELTKFLAEGAREQGTSLTVSRYTRNLPSLEEIIDPMNIHGSLQAAIDDAEKRYADLVQDLLTMHVDPADLVNCAQEFGKKHPVTVDTPEEVFRAFEDFFLDGMPCDHVNQVSDSSSASLTWEITEDVHSTYWQENEGMYQKLRLAVMNGMLAVGSFKAGMPDGAHGIIERK
ncbi:MAG: hypothetical protein PUF68_01310 [Lactimicrobium massiliense]|nr:hypothetical protein [Lactimicrobium massiliense]MDD6457391.1 hypothetical protein [Lactimicrobium massiliense]